MKQFEIPPKEIILSKEQIQEHLDELLTQINQCSPSWKKFGIGPDEANQVWELVDAFVNSVAFSDPFHVEGAIQSIDHHVLMENLDSHNETPGQIMLLLIADKLRKHQQDPAYTTIINTFLMHVITKLYNTRQTSFIPYEDRYESFEEDFMNPYEGESNEFYAHSILKQIGAAATSETVDAMLELTINLGGTMQESIYYVLASDKESSTKKLLELLSETRTDPNNSEEENEWREHLILSLLNNIAIGSAGDTFESSEYLNDIKEMAGFDEQSDQMIVRLSSSGDIGVVDKEGELDRYINTGDWKRGIRFDGQHEFVQRTFSIDNFFSRIEEMAPEEKASYETIIADFKKQYVHFYEKFPMEELGAELANLSIREQMFFFKGFLAASTAEKRAILSSIKDGGEDILRTYALLATGNQENLFLPFHEQAKPRLKQIVYSQLSTISRLIEKIDQQLITFFSNEKADIRSKNQAIREIEQKVARLFKDIQTTVNTKNYDQFIEQVQQVKTSTILFGAICKTQQLEGSLNFETIENTTLENKNASELSEEEKESMYQLFERARKTVYPDELINKDLAGFKARLDDSADTTDIYQLQYDNQLIAFMRFDHESDGSIHAASLNSSPDADKTGIGMAFLGAALNEASKKHIIRGEVSPIPALMDQYVNTFGFVINGVHYEEQDQDLVFTMSIDQDQKRSQNLDQTEYEMITLNTKNQTDLDWIKNELADELAQGAFIREVVRSKTNKDEITIRLERIAQEVALAA